MKLRTWLAVGLLSVSWLPGLGYYAPAGSWTWAVMVLLGVLLLLGREKPMPDRRETWAAVLLMLPVVWFMPWPYKMASALLTAGLALAAVPIPRGWPRRVAPACLAAGSVLLTQGVAICLYAVVTARSHDLPTLLAMVVGWIARLAGADVATAGSTLAVQTSTTTDLLGATWDLVLPPTIVCFVVGAAVMLALNIQGKPRRVCRWLRAIGLTVLVVAAWLPIRLLLFLGLYVQRTALAPSSIPPCVMNQFFVWWLPAVLLAVLVLLSWWFISIRPAPKPKEDEASAEKPPAAEPGTRSRAIAVVLTVLGAALVTFPWAWDPIGSAKEGRIRVVERCSEWEPSDAPYDEQSYGEKASYTYRLIYDYATHRFTMSRLGRSTPISADSLTDCDVLVLKTPTARMSPDEVKAIVNFVEHGGGLLMIGDHTNVFRSSTYLNDVARRFGFTFRNDLLYRVGTPYEQPYRAAAAAHPAVMHVGKMDYAISCSIDPGMSWGRSATSGMGLWGIQSEYQNQNYMPPAEYRSEMRVGPFVQLWATRYGKGRVLAFADSTIFSNFCIFQPGKTKYMLNMLTWLNHRSPMDVRLTWLTVVIPVGVIGVALLVVGIWFGQKRRGGWLLVLSAGLFGSVVCCLMVGALAAAAMPIAPEKTHPFEVVIDRTVSDVPLSKGAYVQVRRLNEDNRMVDVTLTDGMFARGDGIGYGILEQWIPRVGRPKDTETETANPLFYTSRRKGDAAFSGDALVVICPTGSASQDYRDRLVKFVRNGGHLLVLDSPDNVYSTANTLLWPFGLSMDMKHARQGELDLLGRRMGIEINNARAVNGGTTIAEVVKTIQGTQARAPVGAEVSFGKGTVTAVGFASVLNDLALGASWQIDNPSQELMRRYEVLYALVRHAFSSKTEPRP